MCVGRERDYTKCLANPGSICGNKQSKFAKCFRRPTSALEGISKATVAVFMIFSIPGLKFFFSEKFFINCMNPQNAS